MRNVYVLAAALLALAVPASAHDIAAEIRGTGVYGNAGCGLGSLIFGNQPGVAQVFAATTNGILYNQTFGMTSGTSNCGPGIFEVGALAFVEANREVLAKDVARGEGETIGALAAMAGCADARQVGAALQANFGRIFPSAEAPAGEVAKALVVTLRADPSLGCRI